LSVGDISKTPADTLPPRLKPNYVLANKAV
jgi:hypothetical protein